jgi:hypothetical protein
MYLIFAGETYYSGGGGNDFIFQTRDLELAKKIAVQLIGKDVTYRNRSNQDQEKDYFYSSHSNIDWSHVVDAKSGRFVFRAGDDAFGDDREIIEIEGFDLKDLNNL